MESDGQTLPQLPWKQKGGFKKKMIHGNCRYFEFFQPPKAATHYGGYSYKVS
jgi:hypothetical protein